MLWKQNKLVKKIMTDKKALRQLVQANQYSNQSLYLTLKDGTQVKLINVAPKIK